jgi:hypothetical protein
VKRTRADESTGVVIYICTETTQGNSLCSYLYLKLEKNVMFFFFYLLSSFFYKIEEQEGGTGPVCAGGKGVRR